MEYFKHTRLTSHIYRIVDSLDVCCYLVVGTEKACLLDTCTGVGNIKEYVEEITKLPLEVVLSHGHMDHTGGAGWFDKVWMSHSEMPIYENHKKIDFRCGFFNSHLGLSLAPEEFKEVEPGEILDIVPGTVLNLGGVSVELILAKGHTPGMICPMIPEDRAVIIGDACDDNVLLFDQFSSSVSEYKENLLKIKKREDEFDHILGNHGEFVFTSELIENVLECCDLILDGKDEHVPTKTLGAEMFSCFATGENGLRIDGKVGNVLYSEEKVK